MPHTPTLDGVEVVELPTTDKPHFALQHRFGDGERVKGRCVSSTRWTHLLVRRETRKGRRRLYVIRRAESEAGIRNQIRRETAPVGWNSKSDLVVFAVRQ